MKFLVLATLIFSAHIAWGSEVWYTSNVATPDLPEMFSQPQRWSQTRPLINVFKFYQQQLVADEKDQCPMCEDNIFPTFRSHGMFDKLKDWGIQLAVEGGSVKPGDCDAVNNTRAIIDLIDKLKTVDTHLYGIAMDEPFISGKEYCNNQSESATAYYVKRYAETIIEHNEKVWPGTEFKIGLIEAYPAFKMNEIQRFVQLFMQAGYKPAFVHIDVDRNYMKNLKITDSKFKRDLIQISNYLQREGIPLGLIFWGQDGNNKATYAKTVLDFAKRVRRLYGAPEHIGMQSWEEAKDKRRLIPDNLNENQSYSGTNLTLQTLKILGASR